MNQRRCILLDRDGTIIVDRGYLADPAGVELLPGAAEGLRQLSQAGWLLAIVSNQSGIGRGWFTAEQVEAVHLRLVETLAAEKVRLAGIYYCPHTAADDCQCRKPRTALAKQAASELGFDLARSLVIGDKPSDVALGHALGVPGVLVRTGEGAQHEAALQGVATTVVDDLLAAARWIEHHAQPD